MPNPGRSQQPITSLNRGGSSRNWFNEEAHQSEREAVGPLGSGALAQFPRMAGMLTDGIMQISVAATGIILQGGQGDGWIETDANSVSILGRFLPKPGAAPVASSVIGKVWIQFNLDTNPWIPFSHVANDASHDAINLTIKRMRFYVEVIDGANSIYFLVTKAVNLTSNNGGAQPGGGYSSPAGGQSIVPNASQVAGRAPQGEPSQGGGSMHGA
jgi:hypothetical protein